MTVAQKALQFINTAIDNRQTVYISTTLKRTVINPKTFAKWQKSGIDLFKLDREGNLRLAAGKNYNIIATPNICLVKIEAI